MPGCVRHSGASTSGPPWKGACAVDGRRTALPAAKMELNSLRHGNNFSLGSACALKLARDISRMASSLAVAAKRDADVFNCRAEVGATLLRDRMLAEDDDQMSTRGVFHRDASQRPRRDIRTDSAVASVALLQDCAPNTGTVQEVSKASLRSSAPAAFFVSTLQECRPLSMRCSVAPPVRVRCCFFHIGPCDALTHRTCS